MFYSHVKVFIQKCYFISFLDDHPAEATFRGGEYIAYDLQQRGVEPILSTNDEISLYFKTRKSSGLLFYTGIVITDIFNTFFLNILYVVRK